MLTLGKECSLVLFYINKMEKENEEDYWPGSPNHSPWVIISRGGCYKFLYCSVFLAIKHGLGFVLISSFTKW